ncbi:MAG: hypothetical protein ACK52I_03240 [Pseudomonadota bacterium]
MNTPSTILIEQVDNAYRVTITPFPIETISAVSLSLTHPETGYHWSPEGWQRKTYGWGRLAAENHSTAVFVVSRLFADDDLPAARTVKIGVPAALLRSTVEVPGRTAPLPDVRIVEEPPAVIAQAESGEVNVEPRLPEFDFSVQQFEKPSSGESVSADHNLSSRPHRRQSHLWSLIAVPVAALVGAVAGASIYSSFYSIPAREAAVVTQESALAAAKANSDRITAELTAKEREMATRQQAIEAKGKEITAGESSLKSKQQELEHVENNTRQIAIITESKQRETDATISARLEEIARETERLNMDRAAFGGLQKAFETEKRACEATRAASGIEERRLARWSSELEDKASSIRDLEKRLSEKSETYLAV